MDLVGSRNAAVSSSISRRAGGVHVVGAIALLLALSTGASAQNPQLTPDQQAELVLNSARKAYNEKQYPVAIQRFQEFLKAFGGHRDAVSARYGLGLALMEGPQKDYKAAAEALQQVAGVANFPERGLAMYYLAMAYRGQGHEALQLAAAKPNEAPQHINTANGHFGNAAKWFGDAAGAFASRAKIAPDAKELPLEAEWAARARCDLAELLLRLGRPKEALEASAPLVADGVLKRSRYSKLAHYYYGYAAFDLKDYTTAARTLAQLAPFDDPTIGVHTRYLLARTHHLAEDRGEAAALYEAVLAGYENDKATAAKLLQNPAALPGGPEERIRLENLVKRPPDYVARASFYWGVLLFEQEKFAEALARFAAFPQQYKDSPLTAEAQYRQGLCQVELKQYADAAKSLQPLSPHAELGDRAMLWLVRAMVRGADPVQPQTYAQALQGAQGILRQSADKAGQLAAKDPTAKLRRAEALLDLGDTQQLAKQFKEAATTYQQIINENQAPERFEETTQRLATALHLSGQFDPSDQVCQRFQQTYPKSPLLPAVLFRFAENAYVRGMAAEPTKPTPQSPERTKWFTEAMKRYQPLIEKFPEFTYAPTARYRLALCQYQMADYAGASKILRTIAQGDQQGELASVPYYLADCVIRALPPPEEVTEDALAAGRLVQSLDEAAKLLEGFVAVQGTGPQAPDALLKLGHCNQRLASQMADANERNQKLAAARASYEKIMQQFANHALMPNAVFERAKVLAAAGDVGGAMNELGRFRGDPLRKASIAPLALLRLSALLRAQNKAAEAAGLLGETRQQHEGAMAQDPARAEWVPLLQYHQALAMKESGKVPEARGMFEAVVKQFPSWAQAPEAAWRDGECRKELALVRLETGRKLLAKVGAKPEELAAANKEIDESVNALRAVGQYFRDQAAALQQKAAGSPMQQRMLYEAAWSYRLVGEAEAAAARDKLIMEATKKRQDELKALAAADPTQGVPTARPPEILLKAVPLQPAEQQARAQYQALIQSAKAGPLTQHARLELAELHAAREEYDPAIQLLADGLDQEPPADLEDRMHLRQGDCLLAKGDPKGAFEQFAVVAAKQTPLAPEARYRAGECFAQLQDWAKAIEQWTPFRDQAPLQNVPGLSDRALLRLGHALAHAGQWDQSRVTMETLIGRFPQSPWRFDARYGIGWVFQNQKRFDEAVNTYAQVIRETASEVAAKAQLQTGMCRRDQRRFPEAATALLVVPFTYDYPELSAAALFEASRVLADMQQPEQARRLLERLIKEFPQSPWAKPAKESLNGVKKG
jgi:TolA-binding protein